MAISESYTPFKKKKAILEEHAPTNKANIASIRGEKSSPHREMQPSTDPSLPFYKFTAASNPEPLKVIREFF